MRSDVRNYELVRPRDLAGALESLSSSPGALRPIAGGTDLMVLFAAGKLAHSRMLDVSRLAELKGIEVADDWVSIGALATFSDVQAHPILRAEFPMLCKAASETGGWAIQNRGTVGGNIANASPAADSAPALLAYGASIDLVEKGGARRVPYDAFHTGYKRTVMRPSELIARVHLPRSKAHAISSYRKVGPRKAQAISKVCFAGYAEIDRGRVTTVRIAFGGVGPVVLRCRETEAQIARDGVEIDIATATDLLASEISPIDDVRSTARYRLRVAQNLLAIFLSQLRTAPAAVRL